MPLASLPLPDKSTGFLDQAMVFTPLICALIIFSGIKDSSLTKFHIMSEPSEHPQVLLEELGESIRIVPTDVTAF